MRYALIREMDVSNGEGTGVSLFVQGCPFHCLGCFNQETWDFDKGREWTPETEETFFKLIDRPFVTRVSILGGEPLAEQNVETVRELVYKIKMKYTDKQIWVYTGNTYEDIAFEVGDPRRDVLTFIDVLVDGRFVLSKQDITGKYVKWAGSTNQRVIDVQESLKDGEVVLYKSMYNG